MCHGAAFTGRAATATCCRARTVGKCDNPMATQPRSSRQQWQGLAKARNTAATHSSFSSQAWSTPPNVSSSGVLLRNLLPPGVKHRPWPSYLGAFGKGPVGTSSAGWLRRGQQAPMARLKGPSLTGTGSSWQRLQAAGADARREPAARLGRFLSDMPSPPLSQWTHRGSGSRWPVTCGSRPGSAHCGHGSWPASMSLSCPHRRPGQTAGPYRQGGTLRATRSARSPPGPSCCTAGPWR